MAVQQADEPDGASHRRLSTTLAGHMTDVVTIIEEPKAETYLSLLEFALSQGCLFSLVWRDQLEFSPSAVVLADELRADLISEKRTEEWPGTQLLGHLATLRMFRLSTRSLQPLARAGCLYAWEAPERPEDLALYNGDGKCWLGSIAHERDSFVYPEAIDVTALASNVRNLKLEHGNSNRAG